MPHHASTTSGSAALGHGEPQHQFSTTSIATSIPPAGTGTPSSVHVSESGLHCAHGLCPQIRRARGAAGARARLRQAVNDHPIAVVLLSLRLAAARVVRLAAEVGARGAGRVVRFNRRALVALCLAEPLVVAPPARTRSCRGACRADGASAERPRGVTRGRSRIRKRGRRGIQPRRSRAPGSLSRSHPPGALRGGRGPGRVGATACAPL